MPWFIFQPKSSSGEIFSTVGMNKSSSDNRTSENSVLFKSFISILFCKKLGKSSITQVFVFTESSGIIQSFCIIESKFSS